MSRCTIRTISIFLFLILITAALTVSTDTADALIVGGAGEQKIRIAQVDLPNFYYNDKYGSLGGYGYDYLQEIAAYTGWEYEFVRVTPEQGLKMLENGEVDLMAPVLKTPVLQKRLDFSEKEVGLDYSVLCVSVENTETAYNDFTAIDGMRVGLLANDPVSGTLSSYAKTNGFEVNIIMFDSRSSLLKSLHSGDIDAILTSGLEKGPGERIVARFAPSPYYFATASGNKDIMDPLNAALSAIKDKDPYFDFELQRKYFDWSEYTAPIFTTEEKEYIKEVGALRAVYDPEWAPIEYYDDGTGEFSGINADIFKLITEISGLKFSFVRTDSYTEALGMISNYQADILTGIGNDASWADQHHITLTDPYLTASIVLVKNIKVQDMDQAVTALARDYLAATEYVKETIPDSRIKYYNTPEECFEAVNRGKADITYANSYVAEKLLQNPKLNKLAIVETVNLSDRLCIGISSSADAVLRSILNKSIRSISDTQLNSIVFRHTISKEPKVDLEYLLYKNPGYLIAAILCLFLITTVIMVVVIIVKNAHNREIRKIAYLDSVTGTWNFNKFKEDAQLLLKSVKNREYVIIYADICKFSYINDTFGYYAGDVILAEVAKELERTMEEYECSARISADNFVCLVEYEEKDVMLQNVLAFQQRCNDRLAQINSRFKIQFSVAIYKVSYGETDIPSLVGKADIAHKTIGDINRASLVFYDDRIQNEFLQKKKLESAMSSSLENGDFIVYLQPKFDLATKGIVGTEALVRWHHPTEGLILPQQFISLFESNGFILELDFYIYEQVCQMLRRWMDWGRNVMPVSVNVSKAHLADQQFGAQIKALIEKYGIAPELLELELTESILFDDAGEAVSMIRNLKELGFSILIDDFGSGYSSLNLLKDLTVDVLKLDKEFFRKDGMAEKDKIIVDGIIRIANDLNLTILSEGVETQEQVDFLAAAGCHTAQGFFFAKQMPVEEFERLAGY